MANKREKSKRERETMSFFAWILSLIQSFFVKPDEIKNSEEIKLIVPNVVDPVVESSNKRALLIGSNFKFTSSPLSGCLNDLNNIKSWLQTRGFSDITMIADDQELKPTRATIVAQLTEFLKKTTTETLYIHFSGHGTQIGASKLSEESDGKDECICTCEGKYIDIITDNEMNKLIRDHLPVEATLYIIFDCCHSGSILDLRYTYDNDTNNWMESTSINQTECGRIIMMSGCVDEGTSADAQITDSNNKVTFQGALTCSLLNALETNKETEIGGVYKKTVQFLIDNQFDQYPLLSTNTPFVLTSPYLPYAETQTPLP